jgi:UDP-N-acetylmuramate--alanine ligase
MSGGVTPESSGAAPFAGRRLHFIAIGGAGMSGLALVCSGLGAEVGGSDRSDSTYMQRLREAGLEPRIGHDADAVPADAEIVVSTAIGEDNPELVRARERGQRVMHRSELLAELTAAGRLIAVAGAHGKTTTSGMIAHALRAAGADPAFILGGELPGAGAGGGPANAGWGAGDVVVAEADESDGSFLRLDPDVALVTNVELDHHSHWSGEAELWEAFAAFCAKARIVVGPAGAALERLGGGLGFAVDGGEGRGAPATDFRAHSIEPGAGGASFELETPAGALRVRLSVPGLHNVANATAALAAMHAAGAGELLPSLADLAAALEGFPGMARRLELKGTCNGARVYDDYAHHPTEVAASLSAVRELPHERLFVVFQPHLYSRTRALAGRFGRALAGADVVGVLDVYAAREQPTGELEGVSGLMVARAAASAAPGRRVLWLGELDRAAAIVGPLLSDGDILVTIGAGDVFKLGEELVSAPGGVVGPGSNPVLGG